MTERARSFDGAERSLSVTERADGERAVSDEARLVSRQSDRARSVSELGQ